MKTNHRSQTREPSFAICSCSVVGRRSRRGLSYAEVLVAATVLTTIMSLVTVSSFRISRVWKDVRQQQSALNELTSQLDRLTMLPAEQVADLLDSVEASDECKELLSQPKLSGRMKEQSPFGHRLTVSITWQNHAGERGNPLQLSAWRPNSSQREDSQQ